ncbi:hypothetical protein ACFST9_16050 [Hymenobacter monticola]|uniref:Uncharacterized protein n=1 Tax=Hymenobacter monticola TaxID=1705399 RepID=A0ABY4B1B8_9BACT|nr:hypothetical protein [Hymenobacter monticola]UOE32579.1 hypothetical protein MTP16_15745 [Hymenobacter monticola]
MLNFLQTLFRPQRAKAQAPWRAVKLTAGQAKRHARWVEQRVFLNWLGPYYKAYHLRKGGAGGSRGLRVELLAEQGRRGALLFYDPSIGPGNFRHFFEHLGERLLAQGYRRACADRGTRRNAGHTEITLKQLFKPNPTDCPKTGHCNQRFGLITVDLVAVDGTPFFIRIASNAVLDPCFTPAWPFEDLLQCLLDAPLPDAATQARIPEYHDTF